MKKLLCALLALCILLGNVALAEEFALPVLTAQLGKAAQMVESVEQADEYMQVLVVDTAMVTMGRFFGEKTAEELALMFQDGLRDGELLIDGEDGVDERAMFLFDQPDGTYVMDATVIHLDGYTYGMAIVVGADEYFGNDGGEPFSAQADFWVSTLDVFDGEVVSEQEDVSVMLLFDHAYYNEAELIGAETYDETSYSMQLLYDGMVSLHEYALPEMGGDLESELAGIAQRIHGQFRDLEWYQDDALTAQLAGFPVYMAEWMTGQNEDTRTCRALVVQGPQTLVLAAVVPVDWEEDYAAGIEDLFASAEIFVSDAASDSSAALAEQLGYDCFGEYSEFVYVWDEVIDGADYCVYEFVDDVGTPIGVIAVQPETGEALVSYGTDALAPEYQPVMESVG